MTYALAKEAKQDPHDDLRVPLARVCANLGDSMRTDRARAYPDTPVALSVQNPKQP